MSSDILMLGAAFKGIGMVVVNVNQALQGYLASVSTNC